MLLELSHFTNSKGTKTERNRFSDEKFIGDDFLHSRRIQKVTEIIIMMTITFEFLGGFKLWMRLFYCSILGYCFVIHLTDLRKSGFKHVLFYYIQALKKKLNSIALILILINFINVSTNYWPLLLIWQLLQ